MKKWGYSPTFFISSLIKTAYIDKFSLKAYYQK